MKTKHWHTNPWSGDKLQPTYVLYASLDMYVRKDNMQLNTCTDRCLIVHTHTLSNSTLTLTHTHTHTAKTKAMVVCERKTWTWTKYVGVVVKWISFAFKLGTSKKQKPKPKLMGIGSGQGSAVHAAVLPFHLVPPPHPLSFRSRPKSHRLPPPPSTGCIKSVSTFR